MNIALHSEDDRAVCPQLHLLTVGLKCIGGGDEAAKLEDRILTEIPMQPTRPNPTERRDESKFKKMFTSLTYR